MSLISWGEATPLFNFTKLLVIHRIYTHSTCYPIWIKSSLLKFSQAWLTANNTWNFMITNYLTVIVIDH